MSAALRRSPLTQPGPSRAHFLFCAPRALSVASESRPSASEPMPNGVEHPISIKKSISAQALNLTSPRIEMAGNREEKLVARVAADAHALVQRIKSMQTDGPAELCENCSALPLHARSAYPICRCAGLTTSDVPRGCREMLLRCVRTERTRGTRRASAATSSIRFIVWGGSAEQ